MKTFIQVHIWQNLAKLFLEWEMFQTEVVEKYKTHIICLIYFSRKSCRVWDNVEECGRADQATYGTIILSMRSAWWIINAKDTHSEYVINISFLRNSGYANAPRYYVIRILPILY
jgi:hypothetical protein